MATSVSVAVGLDEQVRAYCTQAGVGLGPVIDRALAELTAGAGPWVPIPVGPKTRRPVRIDAGIHAAAGAWRAGMVVGFSVTVEQALAQFLARRNGNGPVASPPPSGAAPYDWG